MGTSLNSIDRITLSFIVLLTAVILFFVSLISSWPQLILKYALLVLAILSLAALHRRLPLNRLVSFLRAFLPILGVLVIFNSLGDIIPFIRRQFYDDVLIRIDFLLFSVHPTVWMERLNNSLLTLMCQLAYISYYAMPIALGISLFIKDKQREFETAVFTVILCFYLSYLGYMLFPAVGPRFTLNHLQTTALQTGPVTLWIQQALDGFEHNKCDAFPSGHTAVALVSLFFAGKYRERVLFWVLVPAVSAMIFSTVYLRYHYVVDLITGMMLALLTVLISQWMQRLFSGSPHQTRD